MNSSWQKWIPVTIALTIAGCAEEAQDLAPAEEAEVWIEPEPTVDPLYRFRGEEEVTCKCYWEIACVSGTGVDYVNVNTIYPVNPSDCAADGLPVIYETCPAVYEYRTPVQAVPRCEVLGSSLEDIPQRGKFEVRVE